MNRVFLSLALGCVVATAGFAQCDPDFSFPDGVAMGISPDPNVGETFANGYLGQEYADTIHMLIPVDWTELNGSSVPIDSIWQSISLVGESGESLLMSDVGLEWTPNNNGNIPEVNTFPGGGQYCVTLTGIPDTTGLFFPRIDLMFWLNNSGSQGIQFMSIEGYTLCFCGSEEHLGCTDENACNYLCCATEDDGSCDYCSCAENPGVGFGLFLGELVAHPDTGELAGMTTYRMYITTPNANDVISAIFGDSQFPPLEISTTTSFYQTPVVSELLGSSINPLVFPFYPNLAYDSWVTIGLEGPPGPNEQAPGTIGNSNNGWEDNFEAGQNLLIQDSIGGAIFMSDPVGNTNSTSGEDQRILIGQFTTDGIMSGLVNVQFYVQGMPTEIIRLIFPFEGTGFFASANGSLCGCTDATASNYDAFAVHDDASCVYGFFGCTNSAACNYDIIADTDDGSCLFLDALEVCGGECTADVDEDGICDDIDDCVSYLQLFDFAPLYYEEDFVGSGEPNTFYVQFDESGTGVFWGIDNSPQNGIEFNFSLCLVGGSIQYQDNYGYVGVVNGDGQIVGEAPYVPLFTMTPIYDVVFGCTDPSACNYLPVASQDDGSCAVFDECGVCGGVGIVPGACDCEGNVTDAIGVCGGDCTSDINSNGVCDSLEIPGCTYAIALNYNPLATDDDGTCELDCPQGVEGCTYELADNFDPAASIDDGTCSFELFTAPCLVYDGNGDGSVGSGDLLGLLTEFGASCN